MGTIVCKAERELEDDPLTGYIAMLAVDTTFRKHGIGENLCLWLPKIQMLLGGEGRGRGTALFVSEFNFHLYGAKLPNFRVQICPQSLLSSTSFQQHLFCRCAGGLICCTTSRHERGVKKGGLSA